MPLLCFNPSLITPLHRTCNQSTTTVHSSSIHHDSALPTPSITMCIQAISTPFLTTAAPIPHRTITMEAPHSSVQSSIAQLQPAINQIQVKPCSLLIPKPLNLSTKSYPNRDPKTQHPSNASPHRPSPNTQTTSRPPFITATPLSSAIDLFRPHLHALQQATGASFLMTRVTTPKRPASLAYLGLPSPKGRAAAQSVAVDLHSSRAAVHPCSLP
ncbi:hypothetical protein M0R45_025911 [Rubus argutus]|uniref:Uncharacterized protein n=1 Tax=Rubus argutus TaxID=59490 RepID=A0AAW1WXS1_RUBAR